MKFASSFLSLWQSSEAVEFYSVGNSSAASGNNPNNPQFWEQYSIKTDSSVE
jgi:hypothetical protein